MMGIFKLPQYQMYCSSDLSVPLILTALTEPNFELQFKFEIAVSR
jgi:hypothetical protein